MRSGVQRRLVGAAVFGSLLALLFSGEEAGQDRLSQVVDQLLEGIAAR